MTEVTTDTTDPRYHPNPNPNRSYYCFSLLLYVYFILLHNPRLPSAAGRWNRGSVMTSVIPVVGLGFDAQSLLYIRRIRNWIYDGRLSSHLVYLVNSASKFRN